MNAAQALAQFDQLRNLQWGAMQVDDDATIVQPTALTHGPDATPQRIIGFESLVGQDDVGDDGEEDMQVVRLPLQLSGREISTPEEVEMVVNELRERLLAQLKDNVRIRLV